MNNLYFLTDFLLNQWSKFLALYLSNWLLTTSLSIVFFGMILSLLIRIKSKGGK